MRDLAVPHYVLCHRRGFVVAVAHMFGKLLQPEVKKFIDERNFTALRNTFAEWPPADLAELITDLEEEEQVVLFRVLPHAVAADVFEYLDLEAQDRLLQASGQE